MLNSNKHGEILKQHNLVTAGLVMTAGAAAVLLDQSWGAHDNAMRRTNPEFLTARQPDARHTLGVLPGCQTDSRKFFDNLVPHAQDTNVVMTSYPERGFDINAVCEGFGNQLLAARAERPSLLCQSMGGIVMRHFLEYAEETGTTEKLGGFGDIILDSSPFDGQDVRAKYRLLIDAVRVGRASRAADYIKRCINRPTVHLNTIYGQGHFIYDKHPSQPLPDIMDSMYYIQGPSDNVINTTLAATKYEQVAPAGKFQLVTDTLRPEHSHTANVPQYDFELQFAGISKAA